MHLTPEAWNISFVGVIFALGGLSLIAIFFSIIGHFFKVNADRNTKKTIPTPPRSAPVETKKETVERIVEVREDDEAETVAAIMSAVYAYAPAGSKILSVKKIDNGGESKRVWRLRDPQMIWRTRKG